LDGGQEKANEDAADRDHHQQFDRGETIAGQGPTAGTKSEND